MSVTSLALSSESAYQRVSTGSRMKTYRRHLSVARAHAATQLDGNDTVINGHVSISGGAYYRVPVASFKSVHATVANLSRALPPPFTPLA